MITSRSIYNKFAPYYRDYSKEKQDYINTVDTLIINHCRQLSINRLIDLGCGDGIRGNYLAKKINVKSVDMVDSSEKMVQLAKKNGNPRVSLGDFSQNGWDKKETYQAVLCLWNVLGHISTHQKRLQSLKNIASLLTDDGIAFIDISNRYNARYYGLAKVWHNLIEDLKRPAYRNGDFSYIIDTGKAKIPSTCHFFNPWEFKKMIRQAGLKVVAQHFVNYENGHLEKSCWTGHLFYVLQKNG